MHSALRKCLARPTLYTVHCVACTQVEAVAKEMDEPRKSVMLVMTAHILASNSAPECRQRSGDADGPGSGIIPSPFLEHKAEHVNLSS